MDSWRLLDDKGSNLIMDLCYPMPCCPLLPPLSLIFPFLSFFIYFYFVSVKMFSTLLLNLSLIRHTVEHCMFSTEFYKFLNVQKRNQLCLSHWSLCWTVDPLNCLRSAHSVLLWHRVWTYGTTSVWLTTAYSSHYTRYGFKWSHSSEEVNKWAKQDCTSVVTFRIAWAYVLCCMLYCTCQLPLQ